MDASAPIPVWLTYPPIVVPKPRPIEADHPAPIGPTELGMMLAILVHL